MTTPVSHKNDGGLVEVTVKSQQGRFDGDFARTDTVQSVITAAASKLGIDAGDRLELVLENDRGTVLSPSTQLDSLLKNPPGQGNGNGPKAKLHFVLTAIGAGV